MYRPPGNILPLALIMMLMILLVGLSISAVSREQISRGKNIDQSIGAYYQANTGVEQELYWLRKNQRSLSEIATLGGTTPTGKWVSVGNLEQNPMKTIPLLKEGSYYVFDLFDPDNVKIGAGARNIQVSWKKSRETSESADCDSGAVDAQVEVGYASWDTSKTPLVLSPYVIEKISRTESPNFDQDLNQRSSYRFRIAPQHCDIKEVQIQAFRNPGGTGAIGSIGDLILTAEGTYAKTTQKISVRMPKLDVLSNQFGYAIFTDCALMKSDAAPTDPAYAACK